MTNVSNSMKGWLEKYKRNSVKLATYDRLETSFALMQKYSIAYIGLLDLRSDDIQEYLNQLVEDGYSLSTIKKQFNLLSAFLKWANTEGIVPRPIQNSVKLPSQSVVRKPKREVEAYSRVEQMALEKVLLTREKSGYPAALLMMETGLRIGEMLALSWDDVDWRRRAIRVNKTLVRLGNRRTMFVQQGAKSYTSNRVIPLSKTAYALLEDLHRNVRDPNGFIIQDEFGRPLTYETMRYQIRQACLEAGVPYLGQHVFRHTFVTNCFYRGCNVKILSKLLGHADVAITYNTYVHLFGDALEEMRNVVE